MILKKNSIKFFYNETIVFLDKILFKLKENMIEFQYFNGCPNAEKTLSNLKELIFEGLIREDEIKITEVPDIDSARELNFQGSPTILINGRDIYTEEKPTSFNYSCRVYTINGIRTGVLPKEFILEKIKKLRV